MRTTSLACFWLQHTFNGALLRASSPVLAAMLDDVAGDGETEAAELRVGGASEPVLRAVLDYAYGGVVRLTEENVEPLLELASRLRMTALVEECVELKSSTRLQCARN